MPSFTMKWLFSQFKDRLVSSHRFNIFSKWVRHVEKESPKTEKSSMNTSIVFSIISWKIDIIHLWNVPGALHSPIRHATLGKCSVHNGTSVRLSCPESFGSFGKISKSTKSGLTTLYVVRVSKTDGSLVGLKNSEELPFSSSYKSLAIMTGKFVVHLLKYAYSDGVAVPLVQPREFINEVQRILVSRVNSDEVGIILLEQETNLLLPLRENHFPERMKQHGVTTEDNIGIGLDYESEFEQPGLERFRCIPLLAGGNVVLWSPQLLTGEFCLVLHVSQHCIICCDISFKSVLEHVYSRIEIVLIYLHVDSETGGKPGGRIWLRPIGGEAQAHTSAIDEGWDWVNECVGKGMEWLHVMVGGSRRLAGKRVERNDEDDSNNEQESSGEDSDQKNDSDDDKTQSDNENDSSSKHETDENESGSESNQDKNEEDKDDEDEVKDKLVKTPSNDSDDEDETKITHKAEGDEDEEMDYTARQLYDDVDIRLNEPIDSDKSFVQEEGTDAAMTNIQQGNENPKILQVIKDAHVTLSTISSKD
ncbi:hypothetical protein Tco_0615441 [Tanacetum coccineum]